jgi:hypothetical protein
VTAVTARTLQLWGFFTISLEASGVAAEASPEPNTSPNQHLKAFSNTGGGLVADLSRDASSAYVVLPLVGPTSGEKSEGIRQHPTHFAFRTSEDLGLALRGSVVGCGVVLGETSADDGPNGDQLGTGQILVGGRRALIPRGRAERARLA